ANDRLQFSATGLPAGLRLSADGVIAGVPTQTGKPAEVHITATDLSGLSQQTTLLLGVVEVPGVIGLSAAPQADRLLHGGENIDLLVQLNEAVVVQGTPVLNLLINDSPAQATYLSGSGKDQLLFRLSAPPYGSGNDIQAMGIETANATLVGLTTGQSLLTQIHGVRTQDIMLDNSAPLAPGLALALDSGADPSDGVSREGRVNVLGLEPQASYAFSLDDGATWTAGTGTQFSLPAASYDPGQIKVRQIDAAGNTSPVAHNLQKWLIDAQAPTAQLSVELPDNASVLKANATATLRLILSEPLPNPPHVDSEAGQLGPWQAVSETEFTATFIPKNLIEGTFALKLGEFQDAAGNPGQYSSQSATTIQVDTRPPLAPSLFLTDTGRSSSDGVSQNPMLQVKGLEPQASWAYSTDGGVNWTNGSGESLTLADGVYPRAQILVRQTDAAGNRSGVGQNALQWQIDTTAPAVMGQAIGGDDVVNASERSAGVWVAGLASGSAQGDGVKVSWGNVQKTTTTAADGSWAVRFASSDIPSGELTSVVQVSVTDLAGNVGSSAPQTVRIDSIAPRLALPQDLLPSTPDGLGEGLAGVVVDNILNAAERAIIVAGPDGTWTLQGSTSAEAGQSVTVYFNARAYNGSVAAGSDGSQRWSAPIASADVAELAHGNRYALAVD
ncbi:MAG: hypothetical protein EBZ76_10765, partial [Synechococcaceae bacterium WB9_2_170]|nr:hypothetical protein [Synechococcaceae bacterium WB9_2_170]